MEVYCPQSDLQAFSSHHIIHSFVRSGLSLRKKSKLLEAIRRCHHPPYNEDVWFGECFYKLGMSDSNFSLKLPPIEVASAFSVETVYSPHPFGAHKPWLYLPRTQVRNLAITCF
jgi:hypothetical protein